MISPRFRLAPSRARVPVLVGVLALLVSASSPTRAQQAPPSPPAPGAPQPAPERGARIPGRATPIPAEVGPQAAHKDETSQNIRRELEPKPNGLTSGEIVAQALEFSPALKKAVLEADKAAANRARAKLAFAPRIDLTAKYTRLSEIELPTFMGFTFPQFLDQYYTQASLMLPVTDLFLTIVPTYKAANLMADVAEAQRQAQVLQVSYDARVAFYDYAHTIGLVVVARSSVGVLEAGVRDLEALVAAGTATQTELVRARAQLANARALQTQAEGAVQVTLERLAQLTGHPVDPGRGIGEPFVGLELGDVPTSQEVLRLAKEARPELLAMRKLRHAREKLLNARKGGQYPQLRATANAYYANPHPRVIPQDDKFKSSWDVGVALSWSPNDAVFAHTQVTDAETELRVADEDLRLLEQGIAIEATTAVTSHHTAAAGITSKTEALGAAERYHADQRALLLAGAATPNDVLEAERDLIQAALEWVDSFIQARRAQAALLKAQGKTGLSSQPVSTAGP